MDAEGAASKGWLDIHGDNWSEVGLSLHRWEGGGGEKCQNLNPFNVLAKCLAKKM